MDKSIAGPFTDFHILELPVFDAEAEGGADQMEALDAGGTGVEDHHVVVFVVDHFQDVGVAADEELGPVGFDQAQGPVVVAAGIAADVGHQDTHPVLFEEVHHGMVVPDIVAVAVAVNAQKGFEGGNLLGNDPGAEVAGMPDDIHRL